MESTLFTTLTVTEEASLSGGWYKKHKPATTTPAPAPAPAPAKPTVSLSNVIQVNVITDSEDAKATNTITIG
ncbi:MAG: hypothetical protein V7K32_17335 [Nostoc sp.]|uniref:hypothetical protein n=1 Tax=Nostoc sp. TaxID=1180 RepID=UPI002FF6223F